MIEDNKLYLSEIINYSYREDDDYENFLHQIFPDKYVDGKVLADWFSSYIVIPKGEIFRWDNIFRRTYMKEEILYFRKGELIHRDIVHNYQIVENGISRLSNKTVIEAIFEEVRNLDWEELGDYFCDEEYTITINKKGKISGVDMRMNYDEEKNKYVYDSEELMCITAIWGAIREMQFDIIKWHGMPYIEEYYIDLNYDEETNTLELLSIDLYDEDEDDNDN